MVIQTIVKIRLIQLFRLFKETGIIRSAVLLSVISFIALFVIQFVQLGKQSVIISSAAGIIILSIHASRKDKRFIKVYFRSGYFIFLSEYLLLSLPLLILFGIYYEWGSAILLLCICLLIPRIYLNLGIRGFSSGFKFLLNPFSSNLSLKISVPVPVDNPKAFEIISGLRRYFIIIIPVYLLFLIFSFKTYVGPAGIIIMSLIFSGFYYTGESREFIQLFSNNYKTFIFKKVILCLKYLFILFGPFVLVTLMFQPSTWYILTGAIIFSILIQIITVIFKYALFTENADLSKNSLIVIVNVVSLLLPFLWPLPVVMCIRYYIKAENNLKDYLYDRD